MSRVFGQFGIRFMQRTRDRAVKSDPAALKSLKDSTSASSKCCSGAFGSTKLSVDEEERLKRTEESLRTVMYLSCWVPN